MVTLLGGKLSFSCSKDKPNYNNDYKPYIQEKKATLLGGI
tara:strand:+ start:128 stop:247 length:120 start_codon:yes stop_codon:yes gene_type:complete